MKNERLVNRRNELLERKDELEANLKPIREEFDRLTQNPRIVELRKIIVAAKPELFEIDNELAALARALGPVKSIKIESGHYADEERSPVAEFN